jgi:hypothetical protein
MRRSAAASLNELRIMKAKGLKATKVPLLYRVNYPEHGQVGFLVKLNRQNHQVYEVFNFSRFRTRQSCRRAAERFARRMNRKFPRLSRQAMAELRRSNFGRGVIGVRRCIKVVNNKPYKFWEATWSPEPNVVKKKLFSISKYGNAEARKLALGARKKGLRSMTK